MGIPYYFYTLTKKYENIVSSKISIVPDIYCLDFNGIIHPICAKLISSSETVDEDNIIAQLYAKVQEDIAGLQPRKVIICIDGVAPLAKMIQQRKRRYLTVLKNKIDNVKAKWDTNAITPGTDFMKKLNTYFKKQIRYNASDTTMVFSGSDEYGEGEHKIFSLLCNDDNDAKIIINGLDADLIILSLLSHKPNIFLLRESGEENTYVNIHNLRLAIIQELMQRFQIASDECLTHDLIESYCVLCTFLGNDFVPHLLNLNLKSNGLEKLLLYAATTYKTCGLLVHNGSINYAALTDVIQQIAKTEDRDVFEETEKYLKFHLHSQNNMPSDFYAIKNKDPIAPMIYANINKWRHIYYKELFNTNIYIDSTVISDACKNYIEGIYWTYAYYKRLPHSTIWYYAYAFPPSARDIANYSLANTEPILKAHDNLRVTSDIQLMIVLPIASSHLVQDKYRKYMQSKSAGLFHLYPQTYRICTFLKTHLWECIPILPNINLEHISKYIK